jgi:glycosyltransferase involved in cell wall biosynthesis
VKRVLFLAYLFPPIANSGTQRPLKFVKYLSQFGWQPTVVTAAHADGHRVDEAMLADIPAGVTVERVPMLNERVRDAIRKWSGGTALGARAADAVSWRLRDRFRSPDLYAQWRPMARRAALRLMREGHFDAIYATGFPWTTLLVGRDVSIATGRPLVADFRDPWVGEDLFRSERPPVAEERPLERQVVEQAASVITVSTTMTKRMVAAYPELEPSKFVTIHNGYDPDDLAAPPPAPHARYRIVFAGVWKDGYNPAPLYDVIAWLQRSQPGLLAGVEVIAAGFEPGEAARRGLSDHITEVGVLPHAEAVSLMHSADLLFLTNGEGSRQQLGLPGKMYEYLATGRPVLALTHPDGDAGRIIQHVGGGVAVAPDDPGLLLEVIAQACQARHLATPPQNREALAAFERPNLAKRLAAVLDEVSSRAPAAAGVHTARAATSSGLAPGAVTESS